MPSTQPWNTPGSAVEEGHVQLSLFISDDLVRFCLDWIILQSMNHLGSGRVTEYRHIFAGRIGGMPYQSPKTVRLIPRFVPSNLAFAHLRPGCLEIPRPCVLHGYLHDDRLRMYAIALLYHN